MVHPIEIGSLKSISILLFLVQYYLSGSISVQSLPQMGIPRGILNQLNATSFLTALSYTESLANATGPGSNVEVSGIVSGSTNATLNSSSNSSDPGSYSISSNGNCSDYSLASAAGGTNAMSGAAGNCTLDTGVDASYQSQQQKQPSKEFSPETLSMKV